MSETTTNTPTPSDEPDKGSGVCVPGEGNEATGGTPQPAPANPPTRDN